MIPAGVYLSLQRLVLVLNAMRCVAVGCFRKCFISL